MKSKSDTPAEDARDRRRRLAERFRDEVARWPTQKLRNALAQPEAVRAAEEREAAKPRRRINSRAEGAVGEREFAELRSTMLSRRTLAASGLCAAAASRVACARTALAAVRISGSAAVGSSPRCARSVS